MLHYTLHTHVSYHVRNITGTFIFHVVSLHPLIFPVGLEQIYVSPLPFVVLTGFTPRTLPI